MSFMLLVMDRVQKGGGGEERRGVEKGVGPFEL